MLQAGHEKATRKVSYMDINIDPEFDRDPYEILKPVLAQHTIVKGRNGVYGGVKIPNNYLLPDQDRDVFIILGFHAVRKVLTDANNFSSAQGYGFSVGKALGNVLFALDEPEHGRYRSLISLAFTHRSVSAEWLDKHVAPVISSSVAEFEKLGRGDLVQLFTLHFPFRVIAEITGVPTKYEEELSELTMDALQLGLDPERALRSLHKMNEIFLEIIAERRKSPKDDFISALIKAELNGDKLSDDDIASFLRNLISAGLDTTYRATGNLLHHLLTNPDQFNELKANPDLLENAIWESLRLEAVGGLVPRMATNDVEVEGVMIPKGAGVMVCHFIANFDPRIWSDPEVFNIKRDRKPILTFGAGVHSCLGNNLARIEIKLAMTAILERLPNLRIDAERWAGTGLHGFGLRSVNQLPVLWDV